MKDTQFRTWVNKFDLCHDVSCECEEAAYMPFSSNEYSRVMLVEGLIYMQYNTPIILGSHEHFRGLVGSIGHSSTHKPKMQ